MKHNFIHFFYLTLLIVIISGCSFKNLDLLKSTQQVSIDSSPRGAKVFIQGEDVGITPLVLTLKTDSSYEIKFIKECFKSNIAFLNSVEINQDRYVTWGMAKELGYYYKLEPFNLLVELNWEHLPETKGLNPFDKMASLISKADTLREKEALSHEDHLLIIDQIVKFYNN